MMYYVTLEQGLVGHVPHALGTWGLPISQGIKIQD